MTINSFYAVNVQSAAQNLSEQLDRFASTFVALCIPHWIEASVNLMRFRLRATPRTNFNYARATGMSPNEISFTDVPESLWRK